MAMMQRNKNNSSLSLKLSANIYELQATNYDIIGASIEANKTFGPGLLESAVKKYDIPNMNESKLDALYGERIGTARIARKVEQVQEAIR